MSRCKSNVLAKVELETDDPEASESFSLAAEAAVRMTSKP
jgi:hypothetical protein